MTAGSLRPAAAGARTRTRRHPERKTKVAVADVEAGALQAAAVAAVNSSGLPVT